MDQQQLPEEIRRLFQQAQREIKLTDGWYEVSCGVKHRGQDKIMTLPLQIMGSTKRIIIEWMIGFDKTDRQVKQSIPIDPSLLQPGWPMFGADLSYGGMLVVPDEVEFESPDNAGGQA